MMHVVCTFELGKDAQGHEQLCEVFGPFEDDQAALRFCDEFNEWGDGKVKWHMVILPLRSGVGVFPR